MIPCRAKADVKQRVLTACLLLMGSIAIAATTTQPSGPAKQAGVPQTRIIKVSGQLTRKGSDYSLWWALRTDDGILYALELSDESQERLFAGWKNKRILIEAVPAGMRGSVQTLSVIKAQSAAKK